MNTSSRKIKKTERVPETGAKKSSQNAGDTELFLKEIHNRAETITPVLKQILEGCPSSRGGMS